MRVTERGGRGREKERHDTLERSTREYIYIYFTERQTEGRDGRSLERAKNETVRNVSNFNPCIIQKKISRQNFLSFRNDNNNTRIRRLDKIRFHRETEEGRRRRRKGRREIRLN